LSGVHRSGGPAIRLVLWALIGAVCLPLAWLGNEAAPVLTEPMFTRVPPARSGVTFRHEHGGSGKKYLVETMGSGAGLLDYDQDGDLDLYLVNGGALPGSPPQSAAARNVLYRNEGGLRFVEAGPETGAGLQGYGMGVAVGDVDNDGWPDLYVTNFGADRLLRNVNGRFVDATRQAGLGQEAWGTSAAFADIDRDGDLDLYVANYLDYSIASNVVCGDLSRGLLSYCGPERYSGAPDVLYRNRGDGTFTEATAEAGLAGVLASDPGKGLGVVFFDADGDGASELFVANDKSMNRLWRNRGDGTFEDISISSGTAFGESGQLHAGMGVDAGDVDGDGRPEIFVTNFQNEPNVLYKNLGQGLFLDAGYASGLGLPSLGSLGFGTGLHDFDGDGALDVFVANGHVFDTIEQTAQGVHHAQEAQVFLGDGRGRFRPVEPAAAGSFFAERHVGRGAAFGDLDGDGDVDVVMTTSNGPVQILENRAGQRNSWIAVRCVGRKSNREGIGARIEVRAGGGFRVREVHRGSSYLSSSSEVVHFGLGQAAAVDQLTVRWPSGLVDTIRDVPVRTFVLVQEGHGLKTR
jgi:hypothetical protein